MDCNEYFFSAQIIFRNVDMTEQNECRTKNASQKHKQFKWGTNDDDTLAATKPDMCDVD